MTDTTGLDRALGAIGTTFRLTRLYPPTHPAVREALRQVGEALPPVAAPASGAVPPASGATPQSAAAADTLMAAKRPSAAFRPDALPPDVAAARAVAAVRAATGPEEQRAAVERLAAVAPQLLGLREVATSADAIAALDHLLSAARDPGLLAAIDAAAVALSDRALVERMVRRLGEPHVPAEEREALVTAVGALASLSMGPVLEAFLAAPVEQRAPFRAAVRKAADRAVEVLQGRLADKDPEVVAAAAEFVGLTGSPQAVTLLVPLLHHPSEFAREAALVGLAEAGGRETARPAMPALKDGRGAVGGAGGAPPSAAGGPAATRCWRRRSRARWPNGWWPRR